jgi:hypothetical protein
MLLLLCCALLEGVALQEAVRHFFASGSAFGFALGLSALGAGGLGAGFQTAGIITSFLISGFQHFSFSAFQLFSISAFQLFPKSHPFSVQPKTSRSA